MPVRSSIRSGSLTTQSRLPLAIEIAALDHEGARRNRSACLTRKRPFRQHHHRATSILHRIDGRQREHQLRLRPGTDLQKRFRKQHLEFLHLRIPLGAKSKWRIAEHLVVACEPLFDIIEGRLAFHQSTSDKWRNRHLRKVYRPLIDVDAFGMQILVLLQRLGHYRSAPAGNIRHESAWLRGQHLHDQRNERRRHAEIIHFRVVCTLGDHAVAILAREHSLIRPERFPESKRFCVLAERLLELKRAIDGIEEVVKLRLVIDLPITQLQHQIGHFCRQVCNRIGIHASAKEVGNSHS